METTAAKVVGPRDGKAGFLGSIGVRFMIDGAEAGDRVSLVEHPMSARALAAPLHRHTREDEYSYVLEGRMGALLGDEVLVAGPGDLVFTQPVAHLLERRRRADPDPGDHLPGRLRAVLRRARRSGRRDAGRAADPGRPVRPLRARDGSRERSRARRALRRALPRRADLAAEARPAGLPRAAGAAAVELVPGRRVAREQLGHGNGP